MNLRRTAIGLYPARRNGKLPLTETSLDVASSHPKKPSFRGSKRERCVTSRSAPMTCLMLVLLMSLSLVGAAPAPAGATPASPVVADSSLLPLPAPKDDATNASQAAHIAAILSQRAQLPGAPGLIALLELMHASGIQVVDASLAGQVVQGAAAPPQIDQIQAGQLLTVHDLLGANDQISLRDLLADLLGGNGSMSDAQFATVLGALDHLLTTYSTSGTLTQKVWANAIIDRSSDPTFWTPPFIDFPVDALQATLIVNFVLALDEAELVSLGVRPSVTQSSLRIPARSVASDCSPESEAEDQLSQARNEAAATPADVATDKLWDAIKETASKLIEDTSEAAGKVVSTISSYLGIAQAAVAVVNLLSTQTAFHIDLSGVSPDQPLVRTHSDSEDGGNLLLTAKVYFQPESHDQWDKCTLAVLDVLTGLIKENPEGGALAHISVRWALYNNYGVTGSNFVQFCFAGEGGCGSGHPQHDAQYTDDAGKTYQAVQGVRQHFVVSDQAVKMMRSAVVAVYADPDQLEDGYANFWHQLAQAAHGGLGGPIQQAVAIGAAAGRLIGP